MTEKDFNPTIIDEGLGALAIAGCIVTSPLTRSWYSKWGAKEDEVELSLPGDELVQDPKMSNTRAITIQAPVGAIWPWIVQMGQGRGCLYSYQRLENLAGCDMHNAERIITEYQDIKVGDKVRLGPEGYPAFDVAVIDPQVVLILRGDTPNSQGNPTTWIWTFFLKTINEGSTRLIIRSWLDYPKNLTNTLIWRVFTDPIHFNMERKMLQGIKVRAEAMVTD
jgi:hypothetical protein